MSRDRLNRINIEIYSTDSNYYEMSAFTSSLSLKVIADSGWFFDELPADVELMVFSFK
jgi:hypothetical protein